MIVDFSRAVSAKNYQFKPHERFGYCVDTNLFGEGRYAFLMIMFTTDGISSYSIKFKFRFAKVAVGALGGKVQLERKSDGYVYVTATDFGHCTHCGLYPLDSPW